MGDQPLLERYQRRGLSHWGRKGVGKLNVNESVEVEYCLYFFVGADLVLDGNLVSNSSA